MRAKIFRLFGMFIASLVVLTFLSYRLGKSLDSNSEGISKFLSETSALSSQISQMQLAVAESFTRDTVEESAKDFERARASIEASENLLGNLSSNDSYKVIRSTKIASSPPQVNTDSASTTSELAEIGALISETAAEITVAKTLLATIQKSVEEIFSSHQNADEQRTQLSKAFRKLPVGELEKKFPEAWANLFRGVLTVMGSATIRDLKFAGLGKFTDGTEGIGSSLDGNSDYAALREQFQKAYEAAANAATVTTHLAYSKYRTESALLLEKSSQLLSAAETAYRQSNETILKEVDQVNSISILLSGVMCVVGAIMVWLTVGGIVNKLRAVIDTTSANSVELESLTGTVEVSSKALNSSVQDQSAAIHEAVAAMREISSMVARTTSQAQNARGIAANLATQMADLQQANQRLKTIVDAFNEIEERTQVINQIVFKTQLLSFNASIEATRAGAHGRGFSVVAQEVGKLAELSGAAAKEINSLLSKSSTEVRRTVDLAGQRISEFETGIRQVRETAESIAQASQEQALGIEETNTSMNRMNELTVQNSTNAGTLLKVSETLGHGSDSVKRSISELSAIVRSGGKNELTQKIKDAALRLVAKRTGRISKNLADNVVSLPTDAEQPLPTTRSLPKSKSKPVDYKDKSFKKVG